MQKAYSQMKHLQIFTAKCLYIIALLSLSLYAFALDQDVQVDILTTKITTALKADKHADALPYFIQLEEMESSLKKPLPESFHFQYIKTLSLTGDKDKALNKSEAYLNKYGKKGKYYSQVLDIISPLQIERDKARKQLGQVEMVKMPIGILKNYKTHGYSEIIVNYHFEIGKFEVTQELWMVVMGDNPSHFKTCGLNCPIENVSWSEVQFFIKKLNILTGQNYRLPTEAEWLYACGAGKSIIKNYCGSDNLDAMVWHDENSNKSTHPVGAKSPNQWGIYDMSGNVWEWVEDNFHIDDYHGIATSAKEAYIGGKYSSKRVVMGGSFTEQSLHFETSGYDTRLDSGTFKGHNNTGFRLARTY